MEETKKLSCIDCNVKKCNVKQNIENHKPYAWRIIWIPRTGRGRLIPIWEMKKI